MNHITLKMPTGREVRIPLADTLGYCCRVLKNQHSPEARAIRAATAISGDSTGLIELAASMLRMEKKK